MVERLEKIDKYYQSRNNNIILLLDSIDDINNLYMSSRSVDAFGSNHIICYNMENIMKRKKISHEKRKMKQKLKVSGNVFKWMNVENFTKNDFTFVNELKNNGYKFIGLDIYSDLTNNYHNIVEYKFPEKVVVIAGNEARGLSEEIKELCDEFLYIPMNGMVESLNVSVAISITFYEYFKQTK